jgi:hypothetical protein
MRLVEGDIEETLPEFLENNPHLIISLLHLDLDIYRPTKIGLELLINRIPKGGIILFDELNSKLFPGETEAFKEVLGVNKFKLSRVSYCPCLSYLVIE